MINWGSSLVTPSLNDLLSLWMADALTAGPTFAHLKLFANNVTVSQTTELADLTEATFTGYAEQNLSAAADWLAALVDANGNVSRRDAVVYHFAASTPNLVPNTIYGYYLTNNANNLLLAAGNFLTPFDFTVDAAALDLELGLRVLAGGVESGVDAEYGVSP